MKKRIKWFFTSLCCLPVILLVILILVFWIFFLPFVALICPDVLERL